MNAVIETLPNREKVRFTDATGAVWTVWDLWRENGKRRRGVPPLSKAVERAFVAANGVKKCYRFTRGESHALTATLLEAQLRGAGYMATEKFNASERGPR